jgi:hypothetical protein
MKNFKVTLNRSTGILYLDSGKSSKPPDEAPKGVQRFNSSFCQENLNQ